MALCEEVAGGRILIPGRFSFLVLLASGLTAFSCWTIPISASTERRLKCLTEAWRPPFRHRIMKAGGVTAVQRGAALTD